MKPNRLTTVTLLLVAVSSSPGSKAVAQEELGEAVLQIAGYLLGEIAKATLKKAVVDPVSDAAAAALTGRRATAEAIDVGRIKRELDQLGEADREHGALIRKLQYDLNDRLTRDQVEALLLTALDRVDRRFAVLARTIEEQGYEMSRASGRLDRVAKELGVTRSELAGLQLRVARHEDRLDRHDRTFVRHEARLAAQDLIVAEVRAEFPRWTPDIQSGELGAAAYAYFLRRDHRRALDEFAFALAYDPSEPALLYGQSLCHWCLGEYDAAKDAVARAVVAERKRPLPRWYVRVSEQIQGPHRDFLEAARHHPTRGVFVAGNHRPPVVGTNAGHLPDRRTARETHQ